MDLKSKIDRAIELDKKMKLDKKELDEIKAELQTIALEDMENKNLKWNQLFGTKGSCDVTYKEKFEIDNYPLLKELFGELLDTKVTKKEEIKFDVESKFKKALIALYNEDYKEHSIKGILVNLGLDDKQIKVAEKKLKGEYLKDKLLLEGLGITGDLEEELDAIREAKNYELIKRYFDEEKIDMDRFKRAIFVEESLSLGLTYEN